MCNHCHSLVDFAVSGCGKTWSETTEEGFTFQCLGSWKVDSLTAELARLTDIVKWMQSGGRVICLPGARIEHVTERVENVLGHGQGGVYISTCRDEQCRQGWNNQNSKEIQRVGRDTEEDES